MTLPAIVAELERLLKIASAVEWLPWQEGVAGRANVVTYDGCDIVGRAMIDNDTDRALVITLRNHAALLLAAARENEAMRKVVEAAETYRNLQRIAESKTMDAMRKPTEATTDAMVRHTRNVLAAESKLGAALSALTPPQGSRNDGK